MIIDRLKNRTPRLGSMSLIIVIAMVLACNSNHLETESSTEQVDLLLTLNEEEDRLMVVRATSKETVVTQVAGDKFRPYLHPIAEPGGLRPITEFSPGHHPHQTGLYWGFTRLNGRDYFHNPGEGYWKRVALHVIDTLGTEVKWQTIYDLLDDEGRPILRESQTWTAIEQGGELLLDLEWQGEAIEEVTVSEYDYGGLFLRAPWHQGVNAELVNAARQRNNQAEGQRAMWVDLGIELEQGGPMTHISIFDHPHNAGFPQPWRVDGQFGVGPVRARMGTWTIEKGQSEIIKHRLLVYNKPFDDVELNSKWEEFAGDKGMYSTASLWGIAQQEGRDAVFLNAEEAVEEMTMVEGYRVNAFASEPMIEQPMAFCWDDRGRLWVAENRDYESRGYGFANSGDSRILILEDLDGDGSADTAKVFLEGVPFPAAIAVGFDGLFLGAPPHLLFVDDNNQDDKATLDDVEILLTGWGIRDRHETINSLHWGPDGWLYGLEGFATPSKIRQARPDDRLYQKGDTFPEDILEGEGVDINGGVWRYHPVKRDFEVVAHGFSNPWGIDYDAMGQMFISACVIPHLFHIIPGGVYHRQGGQHFNPFVYSDIQTIVDHRHRSAHGGARVYLSDAFPEEQHGRIFMANIHEHAVLSDILERKGSGFVASHGEDFLLANNAQWIGFSMEVGPAGNLYVLDWHDADICGKEVLHKETGRIYRITPEHSEAIAFEDRYVDLKRLSDLRLAQLQVSPSAWHARRSRLILQARNVNSTIDPEALAYLKDLAFGREEVAKRLRALWSLHITGHISEDMTVQALKDDEEYIRAWAVQLSTEDGDPGVRVLKEMEKAAGRDRSPVVRLYLAAALQRLSPANRWEIISGLTQSSQDAEDQNIPIMLWLGLEPLVVSNPDEAMQLSFKSKIPHVSKSIIRRLVDADMIDLVVGQLADERNISLPLLDGLESGLNGRSDIEIPESWTRLESNIGSSAKYKDHITRIAQMLGSANASREAMEVVQNPNLPVEDRVQAIESLAAQQWHEFPPIIPNLWGDQELQSSLIRAVGSFDDRNLGIFLLNQYDQLPASQRVEVIQSMASRSTHGWLIAQAIKDNQIPKSDVPAYLARQLRRVVGNGFVEIWGPIDQLSVDVNASYQKYRTLLSSSNLAQADLKNGRKVFQRACQVCHVMYDDGGIIGPDITGSNRTNLDYLLSNILEPNEELQDDYVMSVITTHDGRTYLGNVGSENERTLTILTAGQEPVQISKSQVLSRELTTKSIMPEGLLNTMSDREVIDLIAYLQTGEQVSLTQ